MEDSIELAPAKLTLSLAISGLRPDGYHLLSSEMTTVSLCDEVELIEENRVIIEDPTGRIARLEQAYGPIPLDERNLALRALRLAGRGGGVRIVKRIPFGGGLGGGSADAAAVLRLCGFKPTREQLVSLGADVPFCYRGGRAVVEGIGENVFGLPIRQESFVLFLVPLVLATNEVYRVYDQLVPTESANALTNAAFVCSPRLRRVANEIERLCESRPMLAGSGSSLFLQGRIDDFPGLLDATESTRNGHVVFGELPIEVIEVASVEQSGRGVLV